MEAKRVQDFPPRPHLLYLDSSALQLELPSGLLFEFPIAFAASHGSTVDFVSESDASQTVFALLAAFVSLSHVWSSFAEHWLSEGSCCFLC